MAKGIAYIGPIMMWWNLNDKGLNFHNTLMLKLGTTYYRIEMQITQVLAIPISFLLPITFKS
jgi:hypothetical protein